MHISIFSEYAVLNGPIDPGRLEQAATAAEDFLRSLASRHRLMILCSLMEGELSVTEINRRVGLSQSNLSRHLAMLRADRLVNTRRDGNVIYYRIGSDLVPPILGELYKLFCAPAEAAAGTPEPAAIPLRRAAGA